jgi:uncharacterized damage-inducible protein DinB
MLSHNDSRLKILEDQFNHLVTKQNDIQKRIDTVRQTQQTENEKITATFAGKEAEIKRKLDELAREEQKEIERAKSKLQQQEDQMRREYDGLIRQAETIRHQIDGRKRELDAEAAAKAKVSAGTKSSIPLKR